MSVFQWRGNYLHRRLTKLYSDTKQSYETATVASKTTADEDPMLKALHREFRIQKDRLLAWGLQWSDSNAAPSPDVEIDRKLDQAGLGHVVALVMSDIQKLLIESEMIQNSQASPQEKMPGSQLDFKSSHGKVGLSSDNIAKSQSLLSELITCIDSLYKLSESRRTLSTSSPMEKVSRESLRKVYTASTDPSSSQAHHVCPFSKGAGDAGQCEDLIRCDPLFIDPSRITHASDPTLEYEKPPPYEEVMPLEKTRLAATLDISGLTDVQVSTFCFQDDRPKPIVIEYLPIMSHKGRDRDSQYCTALSHARRIFEHQSSPDVSHTGSLRLLGYTIDNKNACHGYVYELPLRGEHEVFEHGLPTLTNLRAVIPSKRDDADPPSPNLEDRFRLAFNILLSMMYRLHQGLGPESLNSTNIVIMRHRLVKPDMTGKSGLALLDLRQPYLLHTPPPLEPLHLPKELSTSIYRHANDTDEQRSDRSWAFAIYSLGLILLEIGLWTPISRLWKPKYSKSTFNSRIKSIYVPKLASRCGTAYMKVVQTCISAPDILSQDWTMTTASEWNQFWLSYMIKIGQGLSPCCAIDVDGPSCKPDLAYFERLIDSQSCPASPQNLDQNASTRKSTHDVGKNPSNALPTCQVASRTEPSAASTVQRTLLKKWNNVDIPQECLDQWNNNLMPRISKLLQKALDSSPESCSASLMMVGQTPETAKTTICIQCTSVEKVRDCLRRNFRCKNGWGLVVSRGDVRRSGKARRKRKSHESARSGLRPPQSEKSAYQQRPRFGASIGAFRDSEHLPPVSFGGAILVDGKPYGMTVHHMLDPPSDDEDEGFEEDIPRSAANGSDAWLSDLYTQGCHQQCGGDLPEGSDLLEISDDESDCTTIKPEYIDLDTGNCGFWFAGDSDGTPSLEDDLGSDADEDEEGNSCIDGEGEEEEEEDDDRASVGDITGIDPADDEEVYVTQPAIDDVGDDFFPCVEDRDDDHLASHCLGYIHASSGIRRVMTGNIKHEVDWALIKIRDERLAISNTIYEHPNGSKRRKKSKGKPAEEPLSAQKAAVAHLRTIAPSSTLPRLLVRCQGRTSGLQSGRISPALALVKLRGRTSFSSSWVVEGGGFGVPGDSGAWIYDPQTGQLCGHVLAWGKQSRTAYMAPMEILFDDIRRRLGADKVELPDSEGLGGVASRQLKRSEVDLLQDGMQRFCMADLGNSMDQGGQTQLDVEERKPRPGRKPLELALGNLHIGDSLISGQRTDSVALCGKNKDLPSPLTCQAQGRPPGLQTSLENRVLGGRVA